MSVANNEFVQLDLALRSAIAALSPQVIQLTVPADQTRIRHLTLANGGTADLQFSVGESGGSRQWSGSS